MNTAISPRKTFALFCATGKDWRSDTRLTDDLVGRILDAVQKLRGQKQAALQVAEKILSGESIDAIDIISFADIFDMAHSAGHIAATVATPHVMIVQEHANMLDDSSPVKQQWVEPEGVCGFASVIIRPGNCPFANWLKKQMPERVHKHYYGGLSFSVRDYGQSYERKTAYAEAFSKKLNEYGIKSYADSRLD